MSLASKISTALNGQQVGGDNYIMKCCCHDDESSSLSIKDIINKQGEPDVLINCFTGCDWKVVKAKLRDMRLLPEFIPSVHIPGELLPVNFIWDKSRKDSEAVKKVFAARNIKIGYDSPAIRAGEYKDEKLLIYAMTKVGDDKVLAVQRIPYDPETFKKAGKGAMYGKNKNGDNFCRGRGVFFYRKKPVDNFIVGEGIETTLSVMQVMEMNGCACLSTSGIKNITLPDKIENLYILVDSDKKFGGQKACIDLSQKQKNINVFLVTPCDSCFSDKPDKLDFNDLLMADASGENIKERFDSNMSCINFESLKWRPPASAAPTTDTGGDDLLPETIKALEKINKKHGAVLISGKFRILMEIIEDGKNSISFLTTSAFTDFYRIQKVFIKKDDELISKPIGNVWLNWEGRRTYEDITFDPSDKCSPEIYNMFKGLLVPKKGIWEKMLWHTKHIICDGDETNFQYLMAWMARAIQDPGGARPGVAVVLMGCKGTGKGAWIEYLSKIFGKSFFPMAGIEGFVGRFNMYLSKALLVSLNEAVWGGDKKNEGKLKDRITDPTTLFEPKGIDSLVMNNYMNVIIVSNEDNVVPATGDERRFFVLKINEDKKTDLGYFNAFYAEMEAGGSAAMMYDLLKYDYSSVNLRKPPFTAALSEQVETSLPAVLSFWHNLLGRGYLLSDRVTKQPVNSILSQEYSTDWDENEMIIPKYEIYNEFLNWCHDKKEKYIPDNRWFWRTAWSFWPGGNPGKKRIRKDGKQFGVVKVDRLKIMQDAFTEKTKIKFIDDDSDGLLDIDGPDTDFNFGGPDTDFNFGA